MIEINAVIVVEGQHDINKVSSVVKADFIATNGSEISTETINLLKELALKREIIIFTDPDVQGERIRKILSNHLPYASHAFVDKNKAQGKRNIGIEYTDSKTILEALKNCKKSQVNQSLTWEEFISTSITTSDNVKLLRNEVSKRLKLGNVNNKQLFKRLNMFGYNKNDLLTVMEEVKKDISTL